ncbi:hypothetical protein RA11412_0186 [Rothia aeria]|uniref:Uncharacterized protein n=1 Tax=Rothia aeria TaxID=172042 RepID=A0A2Z5QVQ8_9MICC|nr:hypothetical protein RA11412_0186 [Rothia aeria]
MPLSIPEDTLHAHPLRLGRVWVNPVNLLAMICHCGLAA